MAPSKFTPESIEKIRATPEDKDASKNQQKVDIESRLDGVTDIIEDAEGMGNGEVGEQESKGKNRASQGGLKAGAQGDAAAGKKILQLPKVEVMRKQVEVAIMKEIKVLEKQANKIKRNPVGNAHKLNGIISQIRNLHYMLSMVAHATLETLKSWWMKYVQGN